MRRDLIGKEMMIVSKGKQIFKTMMEIFINSQILIITLIIKVNMEAPTVRVLWIKMKIKIVRKRKN